MTDKAITFEPCEYCGRPKSNTQHQPPVCHNVYVCRDLLLKRLTAERATREQAESRLLAITAADQTWPLADVIQRLADFAHDRLTTHGYDGHGWEELHRCRDEAYAARARILSAPIVPSPTPPAAEGAQPVKCTCAYSEKDPDAGCTDLCLCESCHPERGKAEGAKAAEGDGIEWVLKSVYDDSERTIRSLKAQLRACDEERESLLSDALLCLDGLPDDKFCSVRLRDAKERIRKAKKAGV